MSYMDPDKQEQQTAYLFVATFPYSQYPYVEAANSRNPSDWLSCNVHILEFFGGTPVRIVCDNLKTGVAKHPKYGEVVSITSISTAIMLCFLSLFDVQII